MPLEVVWSGTSGFRRQQDIILPPRFYGMDRGVILEAVPRTIPAGSEPGRVRPFTAMHVELRLSPNSDLRMEALSRAVYDKGPVPSHHDVILARHRREAPMVWRAIDELLAHHHGGRRMVERDE